jgi:shikimate dehydrogenase
MTKACVIGWPIAHSRSPLIHGYWLKTYGLQGSYTKEAVRPEELGLFLSNLVAKGFVGCNVTVPHKEAAYHITAKLGGMLHGSCGGVANTLWIGGDGRLHAASTDGAGFMAHLLQTVPNIDLKGRPVMILGAGGAAHSISRMLVTAGERRIANRSYERAAEFARSHPQDNFVVVPWEERSSELKDCALLVNTTTLGMVAQPPLNIDLYALPPDAVVYDIVYVPLETPLLKAARARGLKTVDGLGMLLHQAVPGFQKWFGVKPEVTPELRAVIEADITGPF